MKDCVFCKILKNEIPCFKIYEDEETLAFLDISKDFYGHTLVIPKMHYQNILDSPETVLNSVMKTVKRISSHFISKGFDGVNILNNNNESAGQSVSHFHVHLIPRINNDRLNIFPISNPKNFNLEEIQKKLTL